MKKIIIAITILISSNICKAQVKMEDEMVYHTITTNPFTILDPLSERLQLNYQKLNGSKKFAWEVGGNYIFNEMEATEINDKIKNYWANGFGLNTAAKFFNKKNNYYGIQGRAKFNYMHWLEFIKTTEYMQAITFSQTKSVFMLDFITGRQKIYKNGFVSDIGMSIGLRNKLFSNNINNESTNQLYNEDVLFAPSPDENQISPSINFYYKIGFVAKKGWK